ncbi:MAG: hypothetical protein LBL13_05285 [Bacteroidales bacterium]|jgi:hypothetical protein|nr:hypothetical protein [Bacteroidales bacterium]
MKFSLLFIGLSCCIAGVFLKKDANKKMLGKFLIISGILFIFSALIFLLSGIKTGFMGVIMVVPFVMTGVWIAIKIKDFPPVSDKLTVWQNNILKWCIFSIFMAATILLMVYAAILPLVTLENGVIKMGGSFGDDFKVSDIQAMDTVSVYPKVGLMRGGSGFFVSYIGNFDMENEEKTAKLCIYRNRPPFIKIRMNDNRLLLLNFYEPDKTREFYRRLKNSNH